jgi:SAM-dependent methyltransferase
MKPYLRLLSLALLGSGLAPLITVFASYYALRLVSVELVLVLAGITAAVVVLTVLFYQTLAAFELQLDKAARNQAVFLRSLSDRHIPLAIFGSAALSLFLELTIIRWQGTVFPFFAFYKNFSLLACFAGLGLGYAMASRERVPLFFTLPLLAWQFALMLGMRYGMSDTQLTSLLHLPFSEQLNMGLSAAKSFFQTPHFYSVLATIFLLTALAFIPVGQLCGTLMERSDKLSAYGLNLLGSLAGVLLSFAVSACWAPPLVWFALASTATLFFYFPGRSALLAGLIAAVLALIILSWPVSPAWQRIYSPYQLLEVGRNERGLMLIRAAGHYYQRVYDLSRGNRNVDTDRRLKSIENYYELPYRAYGQPKNVAVVGAGSGNDVAAALRCGSEHVDAIEIDPAIMLLGRFGHPEHPYDDPRVHAIVNDARSFLRNTNQTYDMIVYGLLDSHTLLSHASSVRLDSFVYTVEALREARARLKPDGLLSLSFSMVSPELGRKIYLMLRQAFDGRVPICVTAGYDDAVIFLEGRDKDLVLPSALIQESGFRNSSSTYADPRLHADISTDDWPFFYMPRRVYPFSYLGMFLLIVLLSALLLGNFVDERPQFSDLGFFLLGAGFMLIETKGITELGLTFGNSWQVIGIVIAGLMVMAFLANCAVQWFQIRKPTTPYVLLLATLLVGWLVARAGGFSSTLMGRTATTIVLTCPMFFSGLVFSTLLSVRGRISTIMAVNLMGAMFGGLLEYNSMYFGFRFLYLLAGAIYLLALFSDLVSHRLAPAPTIERTPARTAIV